MIRRSFWAPGKPRLFYDVLESEPDEPKDISVPASLTFLLKDPLINGKPPLVKPSSKIARGDLIRLYENSLDSVVCPIDAQISIVDAYVDNQGEQGSIVSISATSEDTAPVPLPVDETLDFARKFLQKIPGGLDFDVFAQKDMPIKTIVVNCADEDLLSTTNQFIARSCTVEIEDGISVIKKITGVEKVYVAVPETLCSSLNFADVEVLKISNVYPLAIPSMIMKDHLGITVPAGMSSEDLGVCFIRPEALVSLSRIYDKKECDFTKVISVIDKEGLCSRVRAKIGTPISNILNSLNIKIEDQDRVVIGGPMQGFATYTVFHPVTCDINTILVQEHNQISQVLDNTCFNCGNCVRVCPANVPANLLVRHLQVDMYEEAAEKFDLESCLECGLCTYVCTAHIPLLQFVKLGKQELKRLRALQEKEIEGDQGQETEKTEVQDQVA